MALRSGMLEEFPMSMVSVGPLRVPFAGGGYFRLFPLALVERCTQVSPYVMTYFHPRDFDLDQPRLTGLGAIRRFRTYVGLRGSIHKLSQFLGRFGGRSVAEARRSLDWTSQPVIRMSSSSGEGVANQPAAVPCTGRAGGSDDVRNRRAQP
jgi:hypothetical protein